MGFCTNCGKQVDEDSTFCNHCGSKLGQTPGAPAVSASGEWGSAIPPVQGKSKKPLVIGLVAALVVAVVFVACSPLGGAVEGGDRPEVGDRIEFGGYEWCVLEVAGDRALVLSENILEIKEYDNNYQDVTWESCDLRRYLNGDFYNSFTSAERKRIEETRVVNNDNPWYGTSGGRDTDDMVFLLSLEELVRYFGDSGELRNGTGRDNYGFSDQYYSARIAYIRNDWSGWADLGMTRADWEEELESNGGAVASWWWLRSPGDLSSSAAYVFYDGSVNVSGSYVLYSNGGVRPALWLNL